MRVNVIVEDGGGKSLDRVWGCEGGHPALPVSGLLVT